MRNIAFTEILSKIHALPSWPAVVMQLLGSIGQSNADINQLSAMVSKDQALSAKALHLANSSFYGMQRKVTTMPQALSILGLNSLRTLITAAAVIDRFPTKDHGGFDFQIFWRHSIATAVCARLIAKRVDINPESAFMAGLLHDIGRLVLVTGFPEQYQAAMQYRTKHDCTMLEAERAILSYDHTAAGQVLAEHWRFPPAIQMAIAGHHVPDQQWSGGLTNLVQVADAMAHALDLSADEDELVPPFSSHAWNSLNLDQQTVLQVLSETELQFNEMCQILATQVD
ncbi:MAG: HDOD domain-containing protein [Glaciimonas sp.]|nr:HDOD domain-containing protein [Glaciimonas sp.]